jgi:hypothetical protein
MFDFLPRHGKEVSFHPFAQCPHVCIVWFSSRVEEGSGVKTNCFLLFLIFLLSKPRFNCYKPCLISFLLFSIQGSASMVTASASPTVQLAAVVAAALATSLAEALSSGSSESTGSQ